MDLIRILSDLRAQHELVVQAIRALERLAQHGRKRRGRPTQMAEGGSAPGGTQGKAGASTQGSGR